MGFVPSVNSDIWGRGLEEGIVLSSHSSSSVAWVLACSLLERKAVER